MSGNGCPPSFCLAPWLKPSLRAHSTTPQVSMLRKPQAGARRPRKVFLAFGSDQPVAWPATAREGAAAPSARRVSVFQPELIEALAQWLSAPERTTRLANWASGSCWRIFVGIPPAPTALRLAESPTNEAVSRSVPPG